MREIVHNFGNQIDKQTNKAEIGCNVQDFKNVEECGCKQFSIAASVR
ncbi:unnamed protein product [Schistosoma mattheei]|uniref:Uncharacterized protein n=1 Tax=Schistosoma mattheei TaxID=31246 RepID=A0A3P8GYH9_9TREM|nr:unnamed protein product [Schistosoma mattheei]